MKKQIAILVEARKTGSPLTPKQSERLHAKMASSSGIDMPFDEDVEDKDYGYT
jgi:hypothetical protein